jgi:adenosylcobinamide-phosphate synthase
VSIAVALGLVADEFLPEPPNRFHPVAWFGTAMLGYEKRFYQNTRAAGVAHAFAGTALALVAGVVLRRAIGRPAATFVAVTVATGGQMLRDVAGRIGAATDLDEARRLLPSLVGRDPSQLDASEIARAAIESVAENTVDAAICSAFWGVVGGAPAVLAHRAINTMDAMVGHHNDRYKNYGWASAHLDDLAAWLPARLTALLVAVVTPGRYRQIAHAVRKDAPQHPSPNSGVAEAAFAAALDLKLGGTNRYGNTIERRVILHPTGQSPTLADITKTNQLSRRITFLAAALSLFLTLLRELRTWWPRRTDCALH